MKLLQYPSPREQALQEEVERLQFLLKASEFDRDNLVVRARTLEHEREEFRGRSAKLWEEVQALQQQVVRVGLSSTFSRSARVLTLRLDFAEDLMKTSHDWKRMVSSTVLQKLHEAFPEPADTGRMPSRGGP